MIGLASLVTKRKDNMTIAVIIGSTRQGRFSEKPAQWILQQLRKRDTTEDRLLDLRDYPMPFFDQPVPPAMPGRPPYEHEVIKKWTAQIAASDGFVDRLGKIALPGVKIGKREAQCLERRIAV